VRAWKKKNNSLIRHGQCVPAKRTTISHRLSQGCRIIYIYVTSVDAVCKPRGRRVSRLSGNFISHTYNNILWSMCRCVCVCVCYTRKVGGRDGTSGGGGGVGVYPPDDDDDDDDDDNKSIFIIFFPCRAMSVLVASSSSHLFFGVRWSWNEMKKKLDRFPDGYKECQLPTVGLYGGPHLLGITMLFLCVCVCVCVCAFVPVPRSLLLPV